MKYEAPDGTRHNTLPQAAESNDSGKRGRGNDVTPKVLDCAMLCCAVLCCAVQLCCAVLNSAELLLSYDVLCCADIELMLCCADLCSAELLLSYAVLTLS